MSVNAAYYPAAVWSGVTPSRSGRDIDREPNFEDFDQVVAEIIALQRQNTGDFADIINNTGGVSVIGTPVYLDSNGKAVKTDANGSGTRLLFGLVAEDGIAAASLMRVQWRGFMTLTTGQWDTICGTTGGLTPGAAYYLSTTAGALTATAPSTTGDTVLRAIIGMSTTKALIVNEFEKTA